MEFFHGLIILTFVHLLAAASPGPDFVLVTRQTIVNGRKAGLLCSLGISLGLAIHITYSVFGMAAVIASSATLFAALKICGGGYLIYLGVKGLLSKKKEAVHEGPKTSRSSQRGSLKTVGTGFLCNAFNPKAPVYFVSLFTVVLSPDMPLTQLLAYGIWLMLLQFFWFAMVATLLASPPVMKYFHKYAHYLDKALGGALLILGIKVLTTKSSV